jgi:cellulose synthase operon protein C
LKQIRTIKLSKGYAPLLLCAIDLLERPGAADGPETQRYIVQLSHRRGDGPWKESLQTPQPVALAQAMLVFDTALATQIALGYAQQLPASGASSAVSSVSAVASVPTHPAAAVLLAQVHPDGWRLLPLQRRSRVVWRLGELRIASSVPRLIELLETGDAMLDYCLAWAIGRCGDVGALPAMQALEQRGRTPMVKRVAHWASLALLPATAQAALAQRRVDDWPAVLRAQWDIALTADTTQPQASHKAFAVLQEQLNQAATWQSMPYKQWLLELNEVAQLSAPTPSEPNLTASAIARRLLLDQATQLPMQAGAFQTWRQLYKNAEFRGDYTLLGVLHQRLETNKAVFRSGARWVQVNQQYVEPAKELQRPDSRLALSQRTRNYLISRAWRNLRRAAKYDENTWLGLAMGFLLAAQDADDPKAWTQWNVLMHLLHMHSNEWQTNTKHTAWFSDKPAPEKRTYRAEAWPNLWDKHPQALLQLMQESRCKPVHAFAALALQDNATFCASLSDAQLQRLLASRYDATAAFSLQLSRLRIETGGPDATLAWLPALLTSPHAPARQYALDCIARDPHRASQQLPIQLIMLTSIDKQVRQQGGLLLQMALGSNGSLFSALDVCHGLLHWLAQSDVAQELLADICRHIQWAIKEPLTTSVMQVSPVGVLELLHHASPYVVDTAAQWTCLHPAALQALPTHTITQLLESDNDLVRSAGVKLFAALPDAVLVTKPDLFAVFCSSPSANIRLAIEPTLTRLIPDNLDFANTLVPLLREPLFRSEEGPGVTDHLLHLLCGPLAEHTRRTDSDTTERLLAARSKGAQRLGVWLLPALKCAEMTVLQIANLSRVDSVAARQWSMGQLGGNAQRTFAHLDQALRIFDSRWDDVQQWALGWFTEHASHAAWTPEILVRLCDHKTPAVQRLGRELLTQKFDVTDITTYMLQLSQHPSAGMQLFVTNWLAAAAKNQPDMLAKLTPYFLSVLSQANRGRLAKDRVLQFLTAQAAQSKELADLVAKVFARQAVTGAMADKAQYITGLRNIQTHYAELENPLKTIPPRSVPARRGAATLGPVRRSAA